MDIVGLVVGAVLTLLIFSYLLSDNALYRWALALVVGAAVGYAAAIAVRFVSHEWVARGDAALRTATGQIEVSSLTTVLSLLLGCLLLFKGFTSSRFLGRLSVVGNIPLGYLVGAGAAVAVSGALMGTIMPLALATGEGVRLEHGLLPLVQGVIALVTTIVTLLVFSTQARRWQGVEVERPGWRQGLQQIGEALIAVALGAVFAGALSSALTALVMRLWQLAVLLGRVISLAGG